MSEICKVVKSDNMLFFLLLEKNVSYPKDISVSLESTVDNVPEGTERFKVKRNIKLINSFAFKNCKDSLISVDFSSATMLTRIQPFAFAGCYKLDALDFSYCNQLWIIQNSAFKDSGVSRLSLPPNIKVLGNYSFSNCLFSYIMIPGSVYLIGKGAFYNTPINTLYLTKDGDLSIIQSKAFANTNITVFSIPKRVSKIGKRAFENVPLASFSVEPTNPYFVFENGLYSITKERILFVPPFIDGVFQINPRTSIIEPYAMANTNISTINLTCIKKICDHAFMNSKIQKISIPENVKYVGDYAFFNCTLLGSLKVKSIFTVFGENSFKNSGIVCNVKADPMLIRPLTKAGVPLTAFMKCPGETVKMYKK